MSMHAFTFMYIFKIYVYNQTYSCNIAIQIEFTILSHNYSSTHHISIDSQ